MSEQTRAALRAARDCIRGDRYDDGLGSLAEYDAVLAQIDAALAALAAPRLGTGNPKPA